MSKDNPYYSAVPGEPYKNRDDVHVLAAVLFFVALCIAGLLYRSIMGGSL